MLQSLKKEGNNVSVGVRIRPRNEKEIQAGMPVFFRKSSDGSSVEELDENGVVMKHWPYDYVFGDLSTNEEIFSSAGTKLVDAALDGYNTVIFLYGQTSSGKSPYIVSNSIGFVTGNCIFQQEKHSPSLVAKVQLVLSTMPWSMVSYFRFNPYIHGIYLIPSLSSTLQGEK